MTDVVIDHGPDLDTVLEPLMTVTMAISELAPVLGKWQRSPSPKPVAAVASKAKKNLSLNEFLHSTSSPVESPPPDSFQLLGWMVPL